MKDLVRRIPSILILFLALASTACGSMNRRVEGPPPPGPQEGDARIYFALNQGYPPGAAYILKENDLVSYVTNNEHAVVDVPAGEHLFMMISEQDEALSGDFKAGKTYYVKLFVTPGILGTRVYWVLLENSGEDVEIAEEMVVETERVELVKEKAAKWERNNRKNIEKRLESFRTGEDDIENWVKDKHAF